MEIRSNVNGYLSLGFATNQGLMAGTDAIIAYKDQSDVMQVGAYNLGGPGSSPNVVTDAKSSYFTGTPTAQHDGTIMSARFQRALSSSNGVNLAASGSNDINLAYHSAVGATSSNRLLTHSSHSSASIDFSTGCGTVELKSSSSWTPIYVAAPILVIGAVLIVIMSGMAMNSPMQNMSKVLRTRTVLPPSTSKNWVFVNKLTLDVWPTIKGYGVVEIVAVSFVLVILGALIGTIKRDRDSGAVALGWCQIVMLSMIVVPVTKNSVRECSSTFKKSHNLYITHAVSQETHSNILHLLTRTPTTYRYCSTYLEFRSSVPCSTTECWLESLR